MDPELYKAAIEGSSEKLTEDIYLGQVTSSNNTVLHVAAKCGQRKVAEEVLWSNSELLHVANARGNTALHIAARLGHVDTARLLVTRAKEVELELELESGGGPALARAANERGDTALHEAVRGGHYELAALLIDEDRELAGAVNAAGESPLFLAVDRGFYRAVLHMLEASPKCSFAGRNGMNALHAAVIRTHHSNQFKSCNNYKTLALWTKFRCISFALEKLAYFNKYICPAFKFLRSDKLNITGVEFVGKVLQKCPSSMVEADEFGWIPLHYAAHSGNVEVVELFLEINRNSMVYIKDKQGMSALHIAAREGRVAVMRSIVRRCPDTCELLDDSQRTALHLAVHHKRKAAAKFLLATPAFQDLINDQDRDGNTPLHLAAFRGHSEILKMLVKDSRVDKGALNHAGLTIIDILRSSDSPMDLNILKTLSMATLQTKGALPSLEQKVSRETTEPQKIYIDEDERVQDMQLKPGHFASNSQGQAVSTLPEFKNTAGINLLVSTIIAMVTFAAAFAIPGGYNEKGEAISSGKKSFKMFLLFDSLAFGCSAASMFVHFLVSAWPARLGFSYPIYCVTILTELSLVGIALAFVHGSLAVFPENSELANLATNSVLLSFSIPVLYFGLRIGYKAYQLFKGFSAPSKKGGRRKSYKCLP